MIHYITTNGTGNAWVPNELGQLQRAGVPFVLHTMRRPSETFHSSAWARKINEEMQAIYPVPLLGVLASVIAAPFIFRGRFFSALWNALFGERETFRGRVAVIAHFLVACYWARTRRDEEIGHIHSQWIHSCGTIAMYAAWLLDVSFSFTGHAADLFRERVALRDKIRRADFIICISTFHRDFFLENGARAEQLKIAYCGIDANQFSPADKSEITGEETIRIRSSGRLVEKKGFAILLDACKILADRGVPFDCIIGGSGPLEADLRERVERLGITDRVVMTGETLMQEKIPEFMHGGDLYCLPCVWASDDDVDGLPIMLMEAMACGLPAISTRLVGIPDLIAHEKTGLLVEPNNTSELADAIQRLGQDRTLARELAEAGREIVMEKFNLDTCLEPLISEFRARLAPAPISPDDDRAEDAGLSAKHS
jgi:glycosyltransferase involved in cell wall biosynthesis